MRNRNGLRIIEHVTADRHDIQQRIYQENRRAAAFRQIERDRKAARQWSNQPARIPRAVVIVLLVVCVFLVSGEYVARGIEFILGLGGA